MIIASERTLLMFWDWVARRDFFEEKHVLKEFIRYHSFKIQINREYIVKVQNSFYTKDGLSFGIRNHIEYCLITFEQIGLVATIGLSELYEASIYSHISQTSYPDMCYNNAIQVSQSLGEMILNNPGAYYPKYDEHCIEINLGMILFYQTERYDYATEWLIRLITYLRDVFMTTKFFPLFYTSYDKLVENEMDKDKKKETASSHLITVLAEWCIMLKQDELYKMLRKIVKENFKDIDCQLWHPENDTEESLFNSNAMDETGATRSTINLPENPREYEMEMVEESKTFFDESKMKHNEKGIPYIEFLSNRHFRSYVFPNSWRQLLNTRFCFSKKVSQ